MSLEGSRFIRHGEGDLPEVPVLAQEGVATSGDSPAGDDAPKALRDAPPPAEAEGDDPIPILADRGEVSHWGIYAQGRRYRVDEFGHKVASTGTTPGYPVDELKRLSVKQREHIIAEYREAKEALAKDSGNPPAARLAPTGLPGPDDVGILSALETVTMTPPLRGQVGRDTPWFMMPHYHPSRWILMFDHSRSQATRATISLKLRGRWIGKNTCSGSPLNGRPDSL